MRDTCEDRSSSNRQETSSDNQQPLRRIVCLFDRQCCVSHSDTRLGDALMLYDNRIKHLHVAIEQFGTW
jgi:hypothetical protein